MKIIISGGGTGGHVFPAIAIANALREVDPQVDILFVGAEGKMEMEKVPAAGYTIVGLPVAGINRRLLALRNWSVPFKLFRSIRKARRIVRDFKPDVVVGVGGYASAPTLWCAQRRGIPTLIQEQNSYAGLTNKFLARRARKICVAYKGMERFFKDEKKIIFTGNPVRQDLDNVAALRSEALSRFDLDADRKTLLIIGGSLGARTINESVLAHLHSLTAAADIQVLWQVGEVYEKDVRLKMAAYQCHNVKMKNFIRRMDYAFAAADLVISRAGAGAISELCVVRKPAILVPSPNVAEDHQTKNAMALVKNNAAILVPDMEAVNQLIPIALKVLNNGERLQELSHNIGAMAMTNAANDIAKEVLSLIK